MSTWFDNGGWIILPVAACTDYVEQLFKGALGLDLGSLIRAKWFPLYINGDNFNGGLHSKEDLDTENMHNYFSKVGALKQFTGRGMEVGDIIFVNFGGREGHVAVVASADSSSAKGVGDISIQDILDDRGFADGGSSGSSIGEALR